jgi:cytidine deaminase
MADMANRADPDWSVLRNEARAAAEMAYAPYSGLHVGAAGMTLDGTIVSGCNVENASYGLTLCAECGLVSALRRSGASKLVAVAVVGGDGEPLAPCGRCRQVLLDHGGPSMLIDARPAPVPLGDLLPGSFDAAELAARRTPQS